MPPIFLQLDIHKLFTIKFAKKVLTVLHKYVII